MAPKVTKKQSSVSTEKSSKKRPLGVSEKSKKPQNPTKAVAEKPREQSSDEDSDQSSPSPPLKKQKVKKVSKAIALPPSGKGVVQIGVTYEGTTVSPHSKAGYTHVLKLNAENAFKLITTFTASEGEHAGKQCIVIEPAKAFNFLGLEVKIRARVYGWYFANRNNISTPISMEKRKANGDLYAKGFASGSKNRVALLAVSRLVHSEAMPVLYSKPFLLEKPAAIIDLRTSLYDVQGYIRHIQVATWNKAVAKQAFSMLIDVTGLERLHIVEGVASDDNPTKAARAFWDCARRYLTHLADTYHKQTDPRPKTEALNVLSFGPKALAKKDGTAYSSAEKQTFKDELRKRLV